MNMAQLLVETLLFYHPAVWWVSSKIRHERELCCDDMAVRTCGDAVCYARALTTLEKMRVVTHAMALGSNDRSLSYRIHRLFGMEERQLATSRLPAIIAAVMAIGCSALLVNWARAQNPDDLELGDALAKTGHYGEAIQQYETGMPANPAGRIVFLKHEVEVCLRQGKMADAEAKLDQILNLDPKDAQARGLHATFQLDAGNIAGALSELQEVVVAMPDNFVAHYNLGRAYAKTEEAEKARQEFERALDLRPGYTPAQNALRSLPPRLDDTNRLRGPFSPQK